MGPRHHTRSLAGAALALSASAAALALLLPTAPPSRDRGEVAPPPQRATPRSDGQAGAAHEFEPGGATEAAARVALPPVAHASFEPDGDVRCDTAVTSDARRDPSADEPCDAPPAREALRGALVGRLLLDPSIPPAALGVLVRAAHDSGAQPEFAAVAPDGSFTCAELPAGSYAVEAVLHDDWFGADWDADEEPTALPVAGAEAIVLPGLLAHLEPLDLRGQLHAIRLHVRRDRALDTPARCFHGPPGRAPAERSLAWIGPRDQEATLVTTVLPIDVQIVARELEPVHLERIATDQTIELRLTAEAVAERRRLRGE